MSDPTGDIAEQADSRLAPAAVRRARDSAARADDPALLGDSRVMQRTRDRILRLAQLPWPTRVEGERGTGKRVACRLLHAWSPRAQQPLEFCNVNMVPDNLELSKLVGHVKGAFTGAEHDVAGAFETAHMGVLVLDEIADASPRVQGILLQLIEERTFSRIGEVRVRAVDVRIVVATNADLSARVRVGAFRADLLDRLGTPGVRLPALNEHLEDIPLLASHILPRKAREAGLAVRDLTRGELDLFGAYSWSGNVRELEHVIEEFVGFGVISEHVVHAVESMDSWQQRVDEVMRRHGGNKTAAAQELGITRPTLYAELERRRKL